MADFGTMIQALMSTDNALRGQAEAMYQQLLQDSLDATVGNLLHMIRAGDAVSRARCPPADCAAPRSSRSPRLRAAVAAAAQHSHTRQLTDLPPRVALLRACLVSSQNMQAFGAVLLRSAVSPQPPHKRWALLRPETRAQVQTELLGAIQNGTTGFIVRKVCHVVAYISGAEPEHLNWPELLPFVIQCAQTASPLLKEMGFLLLAKISEFNLDILAPHAGPLLPILTAGISDSAPGVQLAAVQAGAGLIISLPSMEQQQAAAQALLPAMFQAVGSALSTDELQAREQLQALVDMSTHASKAFGEKISELVPAMLSTASNTSLEPATRILAIELLVTLCEQSASVLKQSLPTVSSILTMVLTTMREVEADESDWVRAPYVSSEEADDQREEEELASFAADVIGRILDALGDCTVDVLLPVVSEFMGQADWRAQRAAFVGLLELATHTNKAFKKHLRNVVPAIVAKCTSESQRVRYTALECLGVFSDGYQGAFQRLNKSTVVPAMLAALQDPANCDKVKGHAAAAVVNFADPEACPQGCVMPYLAELLQVLCQLLQSASIATQEQALTAVACVAEVVDEEFGTYYDTIMPGVKGIMRTAVDAKQAALRGKAMECASMMGEAVGVDRFRADAVEILQLMFATHSKSGGAAAGQGQDLDSYVSNACARTCKVLGAESEPFLPHLIPPLLVEVAQEVDFKFEDADGGEADAGNEQKGISTMTVNVRGMGDKRVSLNVCAMQEKTDACHTLFEYADTLGPLFAPYVNSVAQATLPNITYKYSADIRTSSALLLPVLVCSLAESGKDPAACSGLVLLGLTQVLEALTVERDAESRVSFLEAVSETMRVVFESGGKSASGDGSFAPSAIKLPEAGVQKLVPALLKYAQDSCTRRGELLAAEAEGGEEEEIAAGLEAEDDTMTNIVDALGYTLKCLRAAFVPLFDSLMVPFFGQFMAEHMPTSLQTNAVCVFDDAIEFCGPAVHKHLAACLPVFVRNLAAEDITLRQCSIYGIAKVVEHARDQPCTAALVPAVLPQLVELIQRPGARDDEHDCCTENAISAVGKICLFHADKCDPAALLPLWLSWLPLKVDEIEAKVMHAQLVRYMEAGDPNVVSEASLPALLRAVSGALGGGVEDEEEEGADLLEDETREKMVVCLKGMLASVPPAAMQAAFGSLTQLQQNTLQEAAQ
jgi:hypothetical protein